MIGDFAGLQIAEATAAPAQIGRSLVRSGCGRGSASGSSVSTLDRAGADAVRWFASTGATAIWNHFRENDTVMVAEGLNVFRRSVPAELAGVSLGDTHIRRETGCNVVAIELGGRMKGNPGVDDVLPADGDLVLIGDADAEGRYTRRYGAARTRRSILGREA